MFTPSNITPLPRRGSPLALILRGILVAAVAMALLVTLAAHPSGSYRDAGSPYRIPWEETLGAPSSRGLPSLDLVGSGTGRARAGSLVKSERTSIVAQPPEGNDYGEDSPPSIPSGISGQEGGEIATSTPLPPTPTPVPPTLTPDSSPTSTSLETLVSPVVLSDLESQMWEAINGERANAGLVPLAIDERLVGLARERSNDMMTRGYFSHTTPEGKMIFDFLDSRGIDSPYAGENLARTNAEASQAVQLVLSGFMNSPTHRKNVLNSHYAHLGIGEAISPVLTGSRGKGMRYFTLVFIGTNL